MKKLVSVLLIFSLALSLFSCTAAPDPTGTAPETAAEPVKSEETVTFDYTLTVPHPLTRAELDALPVANSSMTEDQLRQLCIDFCRLQGSFQWTPSEPFTYSSAKDTHDYYLNVLYGGLPYTQASSNLYNFMDFYDETTGILNVSSIQGGSIGAVLGNDCADAVFWSWARVCNTISYSLTQNMVSKRGCVKLGDYVYDETADDYTKQHTRKICQDNGKQVMYASYALFKPADGMVTSNGSGHARMVIENHPVLTENGYDEKQSYVICLEQYSKREAKRQDGVPVQVVGGTENKYTYANLFSAGYLPFTLAELIGTDPVEKAEVSLDPAPQEGADFKTLAAATLLSNYRISKMFYTITDADGNEVFSATRYGKEKNMYRWELSALLTRSYASAVTPGQEYRIEIKVLVSTGETLTAYSGPIRF